MDVKNRRRGERKAENNPRQYIRVKECPFCGTEAVSRVSGSGQRFFDCFKCGASVIFKFSDEGESLILWENRAYEELSRVE